MHLPPLPLSSNYVDTEGEVSIDPSATIASGVILRAATDSKIIIGAGVCIGIGSILTASQGILEVEAGANLGAGV
jgi:carbon dioxide concentrating mechanism protein CcmN